MAIIFQGSLQEIQLNFQLEFLYLVCDVGINRGLKNSSGKGRGNAKCRRIISSTLREKHNSI